MEERKELQLIQKMTPRAHRRLRRNRRDPGRSQTKVPLEEMCHGAGVLHALRETTS